jgi:hypothetical protein
MGASRHQEVYTHLPILESLRQIFPMLGSPLLLVRFKDRSVSVAAPVGRAAGEDR